MSDRHQRIRELIHKIENLDREVRLELLREEYRRDRDLIGDVQAFLADPSHAAEVPEEVRDDLEEAMKIVTRTLTIEGLGPKSILHYDIESELGRGGMGVVYRAFDTRLGRHVAVKALAEHLTDKPERVERMRREARILARLNHPQIAMIYSLEEVGGQLYLILELVEGRDLKERIDLGLEREEVWPVASQIADALSAAHAQSIVHRDLKPENVMVTEDGRIKILDLGIARSFGSSSTQFLRERRLTSTNMVIGTPDYMSPEQIRGHHVDQRTDVWAFGVLLFECLSGQRPFCAEGLAVLSAIESEEPQWDLLPAATPPRVRSLIEQCLRKDRDERLADLQEAADVLRTLYTPSTTFLGSSPRTPRVSLEPLRRRLGPGETLLLRVVIDNVTDDELQGQFTLVAPEGWAIEGRESRSVQIPPRGRERHLVQARADGLGDLELPELLWAVEGLDPETIRASRATVAVVEDRDPPLVGQESARERVRHWLERPRERAGQIICITGETGSGRNRVLTWAGLQARAVGCRDLRGHAHPGGRGRYLLHNLLRDLLGLVEAEHTDVSLRRFAEGAIAEYLGDDSPTARYLLGSLFADESESLDEEMRQLRWFRLLTSAANEAPLALLIKDLHHADEETVHLLGGVLTRCREEDFPVLVIATIDPSEVERQDTRAPLRQLLQGELSATPVELEPLEEHHVEELIEFHYPASNHRDFFPRLAARIIEKTNGQPSFVREVVRELGAGDGLFESASGGEWTLRAVDDYEAAIDSLSVSYSDIWKARLERLPEACRTPLEYAALLGFTFPVDVLEKLLDDPESLDEGLDALEASGIILAADPEMTRYSFVSSLIPGLVRDEMNRSGRRAAARKRSLLSGAVIELYGTSADHIEWIGLLLAEFDKPAEALDFLVRGLDRRLARGEFADAGVLVPRIEGIVRRVGFDDRAREIAWLLQKSKALSALSKPAQAAEAAEAALAAAQREQRTEEELSARLTLAVIHLQRRAPGRALEHVEEILGQKGEGFPSRQAEARNVLGNIRQAEDRVDEAIDLFRQNLEFYESEGDRSWTGRSCNNLGVMYWRQGRYDEARPFFERTHAIGRELGNLDFESTSANWLATLRVEEGRVDGAWSLCLQAAENFRTLRKWPGLQNCYYNLGRIAQLQGKLESAQQYFQRAAELCREMGDPEYESRNRVERAAVLAILSSDEAIPEYERALELAGRAGNEERRVQCAYLLARLHRKQGAAIPGTIDQVIAAAEPPREEARVAQVLHDWDVARRSGEDVTALRERTSTLVDELGGVLQAPSRVELILQAMPGSANADRAHWEQRLREAPWLDDSADPEQKATAERVIDAQVACFSG